MDVFGCISSIIGKKHLVIEWLSWVPNNSGFINYNVLDTLTDICSTPLGLKTILWRAKGFNQEGYNYSKFRGLTTSRNTFNNKVVHVQITPPSRSILLLIHTPKKWQKVIRDYFHKQTAT